MYLTPLIIENWPNTADQEKLIKFCYLWGHRSADIRNRLHLKSIKQLEYVTCPANLCRKVLGGDYMKYLDFLVLHEILNPVYIGQTKVGQDKIAFEPTKTLLRKSKQWGKFKEESKEIYDAYLNETTIDDDYADAIRSTLEITSYNGNSLSQTVVKDSFAGRYYCYVTNIKSSIRMKNLRIGGEPVASLDVSQSQIHHLHNYLLQQYPELKGQAFDQFMISGKVLYEEFQKHFDIKDRGKAKKVVFAALFGLPSNKASKMLYYLFPELEIPLAEIKGIQNPENPSFKLHANLAYQLQKLEVNVLQHIMDKLIDEDIPFIPIHDSIEVPLSRKEEAFSIMREVLDFYIPRAEIKEKVHSKYKKEAEAIEQELDLILDFAGIQTLAIPS